MLRRYAACEKWVNINVSNYATKELHMICAHVHFSETCCWSPKEELNPHDTDTGYDSLVRRLQYKALFVFTLVLFIRWYFLTHDSVLLCFWLYPEGILFYPPQSRLSIRATHHNVWEIKVCNCVRALKISFSCWDIQIATPSL